MLLGFSRCPPWNRAENDFPYRNGDVSFKKLVWKLVPPVFFRLSSDWTASFWISSSTATYSCRKGEFLYKLILKIRWLEFSFWLEASSDGFSVWIPIFSFFVQILCYRRINPGNFVPLDFYICRIQKILRCAQNSCTTSIFAKNNAFM